jgi:hypothetical protein
MVFKKKVSIIILIFLSLELLFYFSFKSSNNIIFENRFETENRYYEGRGVLKEKQNLIIKLQFLVVLLLKDMGLQLVLPKY